MRKMVSFLMVVVLMVSPVYALRDSVEIRGDLERKLNLPYRGMEGQDITLFGGRAGGGFTPFGSACGLNAGFNFMYGILNNLGQLQQFITNWQSAATILALYALATYLPVAKEAVMGANTLSNFLSQLTSFSCSQAMETIKELNMQDSYLVKRCISNRLGINDPDALKAENPQRWYEAYKQCLNSASLTDIFGGRDGALKYLKFISPKSLAKCYLGVRNTPTPEEIANADLSTKSKYFLYLILPDFTLTADGLVKVQTVRIRDPRTNQERPATLVDFTNFHIEQLEKDYDDMVDTLRRVARWESRVEDVKRSGSQAIEEFERKYGVRTDSFIDDLIVSLIMLDGIERAMRGESVDSSFDTLKGSTELYYMAEKLKSAIYENLKAYVVVLALDVLEMALVEQASRLKQAETLRKNTGSGGMTNEDGNCPSGISM